VTEVPATLAPTAAVENLTEPGEIARWGMGDVYHQVISPDDKFLVLGTATGIYVYDTATMQLSTRLGEDGVPAKWLLFSKNGKYLAVAPSYVQVDVYDFAQDKLLFSLGKDIADPEKITPDGPFFAFTSDESVLYFYNRNNDTLESYGLSDGKNTTSWKLNQYGNDVRLFLSSDEQYLLCLNSQSGKIVNIKNQNEIENLYYGWSGDGNYIISPDHSVFVVNAFERTNIVEFIGNGGVTNTEITSGKIPDITVPTESRLFKQVDLSPDKNTVALLTYDNRICLWSVTYKKSKFCLPENSQKILSIKFSPDSKWLLTIYDSKIQWWDLNTLSKEDALSSEYAMRSVIFSHKGDFLIDRNFSPDESARELVFNKFTVLPPRAIGQDLFSLAGTIHTSKYQGDTILSIVNPMKLIFAENGLKSETLVLVSGTQFGPSLKNPDTGEILAKVNLKSTSTKLASSPDQKFISLAYTPGEQLIITAADLDKQYLANSGLKTLNSVDKTWKVCRSLSVSNSGLLAASVASENRESSSVGVWSIPKGDLISTIPVDSQAVSISPDGSKLAVQVNSDVNQIFIYGLKSPEKPEKARIIDMVNYSGGKPGSHSISSLTYSPDGAWLAVASGSTYGDIYIIETTNWNKLYTLEGHSETISGLVFSFDGRYLYSSSDDGTTRTWGPFSTSNTEKSLPVNPAEKTVIGFPQNSVLESQVAELTAQNVNQLQEVNRWQVGVRSDEDTCWGCVWHITSAKDEDGWSYIYSTSETELSKLYPFSPELAGKKSLKIQSNDYPYDVVLSGDGNVIAARKEANQGIDIYNKNGEFIQKVKGFTNDSAYGNLVLSQNGRFLFATSSAYSNTGQTELIVWDLQENPAKTLSKFDIASTTDSLSLHEEDTGDFTLYFSAENSAGTDKQTCIPSFHISADGRTGKEERICGSFFDYSSDVVISPDNKLLGVIGPYNTLSIYNRDTLEKLTDIKLGKYTYKGEESDLTFSSIIFLQDMKGLLVSSYDGFIRLYGVKK
jgi:WD40 repeat protein